MKMDDYQEKASTTARYGQAIEKFVLDCFKSKNAEPVIKLLRLLYTTLGLVGEAGELADQVKRVIRDDGGFLSVERLDKLIKESGDVQWYLAGVASELNTSLELVATKNLEKLAARREQNKINGEGSER